MTLSFETRDALPMLGAVAASEKRQPGVDSSAIFCADRERRSAEETRMAKHIDYSISHTALGKLLIAATARGVCRVAFGESEAELEALLKAELPFAALVRDEVALKPWSEALASYVDGHAQRLDVPLDVAGSRFRMRVWEALRAIPRGSTRSYAEVARSLGAPHGARAVGQACARNPVAIAIPCHRVLAADGTLGGYAFGLARKRALLEREGALSPK